MTDEFKRPEITNITHFADYGINYLTGEACAYGLRILCDVSQQGKDLLEEFLSTRLNMYDRRNPYFYNSKDEKQESIGSLMLTGAIFRDLAIFIMFYVEGCALVAFKPDRLQVYGYMAGDTQKGMDIGECMSKFGYEVRRNIRGLGGQPYKGSMNVHGFTGRTH